MSRWFPKSLFGQTLLVLLAGLIVSHALGAWIYTADREQAVRAVGGFATAQRVANLTRLVRDAPREWRQRLVGALSDQTFQVSISGQPPRPVAAGDDNAASLAIKAFLTEQVPPVAGSQPHVLVAASDGPPFGGGHRAMGRGPMMHGFGGYASFGAFRELQVAMPLADGQWLWFVTTLPDTGPGFSLQFLISMAAMAIIILGVSVWAVRRVAAPLASLAVAADRLGRDVTTAPLPESGTIETRQASRAFNDMQVRLRDLIENRTRLLAAISHDLRTPLTLLRLRAENVEDVSERDKMLATISEMNSMVGATLAFARDESVAEPRRATDLASLVASVTDDMGDAGLPVILQAPRPVVYECRPNALKRALTNLIENAVKYGNKATVSLNATPTEIEIAVEDEGPGIPEAELSRVLEPFYRIEESRSRDTGGVGLGLAIALSVVQAHGGKLVLSNRPSGGLRAAIKLPV